MNVRRGEPWGSETDAQPDVVVVGDDRDLARAAAQHRGQLVAFVPNEHSDFARSLGLRPNRQPSQREVAVDVLALDNEIAINAVVVGAPPVATTWRVPWLHIQLTVDGKQAFNSRATGVVIASGQYIDGLDVNPRSHPGDGVAEAYVFAMSRGERRRMRARLPSGTHLPHPHILRANGRVFTISLQPGAPVVSDAIGRGESRSVRVTVEAAALRLLV